MIDGLEVQVGAEIEIGGQCFGRDAALLVGQGAGDHVDPVALDRADHQVTARLQPRFAQFLRLAMNLAAMRHADV